MDGRWSEMISEPSVEVSQQISEISILHWEGVLFCRQVLFLFPVQTEFYFHQIGTVLIVKRKRSVHFKTKMIIFIHKSSILHVNISTIANIFTILVVVSLFILSVTCTHDQKKHTVDDISFFTDPLFKLCKTVRLIHVLIVIQNVGWCMYLF